MKPADSTPRGLSVWQAAEDPWEPPVAEPWSTSSPSSPYCCSAQAQERRQILLRAPSLQVCALSLSESLLNRGDKHGRHRLVAFGVGVQTVHREGVFEPAPLIHGHAEIVHIESPDLRGVILHPGIQLQDIARRMTVRHLGGDARRAAP